MTDEYLNCPFCKEGDFDLIGLKYHLEMGWCKEYEETDTSECRSIGGIK